jgi:hypothetical protein
MDAIKPARTVPTLLHHVRRGLPAASAGKLRK